MRSAHCGFDRAIRAQPASGGPIRRSGGASIPEDVVKLPRIEQGIRPRFRILQRRRPDRHIHTLGNGTEALS